MLSHQYLDTYNILNMTTFLFNVQTVLKSITFLPVISYLGPSMLSSTADEDREDQSESHVAYDH